MKLENPILKGFNPDPSICRVNNDYYIATSTFQFFPGVRIYHSQDLVNWTLIDRPLVRVSQLDLRGIKPGGGVQAPHLSFRAGVFYLVYTVVYEPTPKCYYVTTKKIGTNWSKPIYINSSGIDQSFFHDQSNKTYVLTNETILEKDFYGVFQGNHNRIFQGINLQEFSLTSKKLLGEPKNIFKGTKLDITEAPLIFKKHGFYYLMVAEGGTGYKHAITVARSKKLYGPYKTDPNGPILSATNDPDLKFQKAGHGSIVEDAKGNVFLVALASRPTHKGERNGSPFGRETILLRYKWTKAKWLKNYYDKNIPQAQIDLDYDLKKEETKSLVYDFTNLKTLPLALWTVREPITSDWAQLTAQGLKIRGRNNIHSLYEQSSIHKIWTSLNFEFETKFVFKPQHYKQKAGIMQKYSEYDQIFFNVTLKYNGQKMVQLGVTKNQKTTFIEERIIDQNATSFTFKSVVKDEKIMFFYKIGGRNYQKMETSLQTSLLFEQNVSSWGYTGAVMGIFVQDEFNLQKVAIFKYWKYCES